MALVDRASTLKLFYRRVDTSTSTSIASTIPSILPGESRLESTTDELGASGRLISRTSGWLVQASVLDSERDRFFSPTDDSAWNIGVGRYIPDMTTLAFGYGELEVGFFDYETIGLDIEDVGSLAGSWQYGIDMSYKRIEGAGDDLNDWRVAVAMYPSRDFEFGVSYADQLARVGISFSPAEVESVEGFLSWFVRSNVELGARYRVDDFSRFGD